MPFPILEISASEMGKVCWMKLGVLTLTSKRLDHHLPSSVYRSPVNESQLDMRQNIPIRHLIYWCHFFP